MKVQSVDAFITTHGVKCLLTGASGSGKTRSILSLKDAGFKPLLISAESGVLSLAGSAIPMIDLAKDDEGKEIALKDRMARLSKVFEFLKSGQKDYDTVVLDSLTEVNQSLIAFLKAKYTDPKDTLKVYGDNFEIMIKLCREFRDLPYNVVLIALSEIEKDDLGRRFTTASVIGKVAGQLPALFDEVFNLQVYEEEKKIMRRFQTQGNGDVVCKDRSGKLSVFEPYDLGAIFKKIKHKPEEKKEEKK